MNKFTVPSNSEETGARDMDTKKEGEKDTGKAIK